MPKASSKFRMLQGMVKMAHTSRKPSDVWKFFIKIANGGKCKICFTEVISRSTTTNLKNHLIRKHSDNCEVGQIFGKNMTAETNQLSDNGSTVSTPRPLRSITPESECIPPTRSITDLDSSFSSGSRIQQPHIQPRIDCTLRKIKSFEEGGSKSGEITNAILFMIAKQNLPFSFVESEGFKYLINIVSPLYGKNMPQRAAYTGYMDKKYEYLSGITKEKLKSIDYFSLTSDVWTETHNTVGFLGMTAHYEMAGEMHSTIVGVLDLSDRHTAENLGKWMTDMMDDWNLRKDKLVAIVTDNGINMVNAVKETFGANRHLPCFAHTLNLVAEKTMDYDEAKSLVSKVKRIVTYFKHSTVGADELKKNSDHKLIQSVETRWNSTYWMLERFIMLADSVGSILLKIPKSPMMLSADELQLAEEIMQVLQPIERVSTELCGQKYVTISKVIPIINCLKIEIMNIRQKLQTSTALILVDRLESEIKKKFEHVAANHIIAVSSILDPRFKRLHFRKDQYSDCAKAVNYIAKCMKEIDQTALLSGSGDTSVSQERIESDGIWCHHENLLKVQVSAEDQRDSDELPTDLKHYLNQPLAKLSEEPMYFWSNQYKTMYPSLSAIARKYLPVVATSVPCERLFSKAGLIMTDTRSRLSPDHLQKLLFLGSLTAQQWQLKN